MHKVVYKHWLLGFEVEKRRQPEHGKREVLLHPLST